MTGFITANTTLNVPATYATPWAAMDYLMDYIIYPRAKVTIQVAAGDYVHTAPLPNHPQNSQIEIIGPTLTFPTGSDFVITGSSSGARATDNANHLTMLQGKYGARIECNACSFVDSRKGYGVPTLTNILAWTTNSTDVGMHIYDCLVYLNQFSIHGFTGLLMALVNGGNVRTGNITLSGGGTNGVQASDSSVFKSVNTFISASNGNVGAFVKRCGVMELYAGIVKGNAADGVLIQDDGAIEIANGVVSDNGGSGYKVELGGTLNAVGASSVGNGEYGYHVVNGGSMFASNSSANNNGLSGYRSERIGAFLDCRNSASQNNGVHGIHAIVGGKVDAGGATTVNNASAGVRIDEGGSVFFQTGTCTGNGSRGIYVVSGGQADAENATINSNGSNEVQVVNAGNVRITGTGLTSVDTSPAINTPGGTANQALIWS